MPGIHQRSNAKSRLIDKEFPYQVALPDDLCCMENLTIIMEFCRRFPYRVPTKCVTAAWPNGTWLRMRLHCFANRADAEEFAAHFEGEHFDPKKDRGKGHHRGIWRRQGNWEHSERSGPLKVPKFFREHP